MAGARQEWAAFNPGSAYRSSGMSDGFSAQLPAWTARRFKLQILSDRDAHQQLLHVIICTPRRQLECAPHKLVP